MPYTTYDFRLLFSGLCAFVPDVDLNPPAEQPGPPPSQVRALLINTASEQERFGEMNHSETHIPLLCFDLRGLPGGVYDIDGSAGVWFLDFEDVSLHFMRGEEEYPVGGLRIVLDGSNESFSLVPLMEDVLPGAGAVDPDCLLDLPEYDMTIARFNLDKGTLKTHLLGEYRGETVTAQFVPPPSEDLDPIKQALPRIVSLEVPAIPDDVDVVIVAERFQGEDRKRTLRLRPVADEDRPGKKLVRVEVRHLCCDSVLADKRVEDFPEPDLDFEYYYLVAKEYERLNKEVVRFPVPVPVEFTNSTDGGQSGGDTIKCSSARFLAPTGTREPSSSSKKEAD